MTNSFLAAHLEPNLLAMMVLVVIAIVIGAFFMGKKTHDKWAALNEKIGLGPTDDADIRAGDIDGVAVAVRTFMRGSGKNRRRYTAVECRGRERTTVEMAPDGFWKRLIDNDVQVGDPSLDHRVRFNGRRDELLALLDAVLRDHVDRAVGSGWRFEAGTWKRELSGYALDDLEHTVETGVALATVTDKAIVAAASVPASLAQRVRIDPVATVRLAALEELVRLHARAPEAEVAVTAGLRDADARVRLLAAEQRGDIDTLAALVSESDANIAANAIEHLALRHAERARALASMADDTLVVRLEDPRERVRLAACRALGALGGIGAVAALVPLRDKFMGGDVKDAAKAAITAIQARAGGVEAGRLSMAESSHEGALALATVEEEQQAG